MTLHSSYARRKSVTIAGGLWLLVIATNSAIFSTTSTTTTSTAANWFAVVLGVSAEDYSGLEEEDIWAAGSIWDIYWLLDCEIEHHAKESQIYNQTVWDFLRNAYRETVATKDQADMAAAVAAAAAGADPPRGNDVPFDWGYQVPVEVRQSPGAGRGIFATAEIPKGTLVWESIHTAQFTSGHAYRNFLRRIPDYLACDVLIWAYTRLKATSATDVNMDKDDDNDDDDDDDDEDIHPVVCVDLDPGSFVNECETDDECNMALGSGTEDRPTGCELRFHALYDIPAETELRIDYAFSAMNEGWFALGLMWDPSSAAATARAQQTEL